MTYSPTASVWAHSRGEHLRPARPSLDVVNHLDLADQEGRDELHRRDERRGDGEVSGGVGSAGEDMTNANKGRRSTFKHSTVIKGHKTSVSLEKEFWSALKEIAIVQGTTVHALIGAIDLKRDHTNLCSALRLFVLDFYRKQLPPL